MVTNSENVSVHNNNGIFQLISNFSIGTSAILLVYENSVAVAFLYAEIPIDLG